MTLELILGVLHNHGLSSSLSSEEKALNVADALIKQEYQNSPTSILVELPPSAEREQELWKNVFFMRLAKRYSEKRTKIIYGDIGRREIPKWVSRKLEKIGELDNPNTGVLDFLDFIPAVLYYLTINYWLEYLDSTITHSHRRDKGILKAIELNDPQVVVIGRTHANYIKRMFPEVQYIAFCHTKSDTRPMALGDTKPYRPNRIINLD